MSEIPLRVYAISMALTAGLTIGITLFVMFVAGRIIKRQERYTAATEVKA